MEDTTDLDELLSFHIGETVYITDNRSPYYSQQGRILAHLVGKHAHVPSGQLVEQEALSKEVPRHSLPFAEALPAALRLVRPAWAEPEVVA